MKMNVNNYNELCTSLIDAKNEKYVYMYNKNELICTCHNKDINKITINELINCKKLYVVVNNHCIISCDEIMF